MHHVLDGDKWSPFPGVSIPLPHLPVLQLGSLTIDPSITLHVLMLILSALLTFLILKAGARRTGPGGALPQGRFGHAIEATILFLRDTVVRPNIGEKEGDKWLPFLGTLFFLIAVSNLLGLIPCFAGATADISVTAALAIMSFIIFNTVGIRKHGAFQYVKGIVPSGIPAPILVLLYPIEILSLFIRAFSLTLRLFANMLSGHIMILVLAGMVSVFAQMMPAPAALGFVGPLVVVFTVFIMVIKVFICFLQAYVFTLLSCAYISGAIHQEG